MDASSPTLDSSAQVSDSEGEFDLAEVIKTLQAFIRGTLVRRHFREIQQLYEQIVSDIDGNDVVLEWPTSPVAKPIFRDRVKHSSGKILLQKNLANSRAFRDAHKFTGMEVATNKRKLQPKHSNQVLKRRSNPNNIEVERGQGERYEGVLESSKTTRHHPSTVDSEIDRHINSEAYNDIKEDSDNTHCQYCSSHNKPAQSLPEESVLTTETAQYHKQTSECDPSKTPGESQQNDRLIRVGESSASPFSTVPRLVCVEVQTDDLGTPLQNEDAAVENSAIVGDEKIFLSGLDQNEYRDLSSVNIQQKETFSDCLSTFTDHSANANESYPPDSPTSDPRAGEEQQSSKAEDKLEGDYDKGDKACTLQVVEKEMEDKSRDMGEFERQQSGQASPNNLKEGRQNGGIVVHETMDDVPRDKASLLDRKNSILMELLWVQQAIVSRKNYLRMRQQVQ